MNCNFYYSLVYNFDYVYYFAKLLPRVRNFNLKITIKIEKLINGIRIKYC